MVPRMRIVIGLAALGAAVALAGCGEFPAQDYGPSSSMDLSGTPDPIPRWEQRSPYGNQDYQVSGITYHVLQDATGYSERGLASWYGMKFNGQYTSSREIYNMYGMTAAHRTLPLPSYVRVTNLQNGRTCIVRVNDRGPFHSDRLIDLSYAAASKLGIVESGTAMVELQLLDPNAGPEEPRVSEVVSTAQPAFRGDEASGARFMPVEEPPAAPATPTAPAASGPLPGAPAVPALKPAPAPADAPAAPAAPAQKPAPATAARTWLQVGVFAQRENAERLRRQLTAEKMSATIQEGGDRAKKVLYILRVGPVKDADIGQISKRLEEIGAGKPRVIHE
jgi:rare lipoprotein A